MSLKLPPLPSFSDNYDGRKTRTFVTIIENTFNKLANLTLRSEVQHTYTYSSAQSTNGNNITTLRDIVIPANSLRANGWQLNFHVWGTYGVNSNNKQLKLFINNGIVYDSGNVDGMGAWIIDGQVVRTGQKEEKCLIRTNNNSSGGAITSGSLTLDASKPITIKVTGQGTESADITCNVLMVSIVPGEAL